MIQIASLRAISAFVLVGFLSFAQTPMHPNCHDDYTADSFEMVEDNMEEFIEEYFTDPKIPFLPKAENISSLGLLPAKNNKDIYIAKDATIRAGGKRDYPDKTGIWKIELIGKEILQTHLLIKEPESLSENRAFNTYNDLLGDIFADYDSQAYIMTTQPEDLRYRYSDTYFSVNISIYGTKSDATALPKTVADIVLTDYTSWVNTNKECHKK